jgi:hypothetical protein
LLPFGNDLPLGVVRVDKQLLLSIRQASRFHHATLIILVTFLVHAHGVLLADFAIVVVF